MADESAKQSYRCAWEAWTKQLDSLHATLLEGERLEPAKLKGLLNRESRAKEAYDSSRLRLLGLESEPFVPADPETNPFR